MNLMETYQKRLAVSESVYAKSHGGETLSNAGKIAVATILNNTNRFMTEAFNNSVGTQRADMHEWKKFCLNLTTVAVPNLVAHELVIVYPMSSISGYVTYIQYTAGSNKGKTKQGDVFNDPFRLGAVDVDYTGASVSEEHTVVASEIVSTVAKVALKWTPVVSLKKVFVTTDTAATEYTVVAPTATLAHEQCKLEAEGSNVIVFYANDISAGNKISALYAYDNVVIPQNDIPTINAEIKSIPLIAKPRRVAVYYSQLAAFQAKQDYGFDLGDQLAEKAVGQLEYEIDTEVTNLLVANAGEDSDLVWSKTLPVGVSKAQHYEGFTEIIELAKQKIYDKTKRFAPNYMLISSSILPILSFIPGFKAASVSKINGPYMCGTLGAGALKVFVTPNIAVNKFILGVNGDDMMSSAAVYAPYMAVVPTQLLGYADGSMSQGFSTLYALEMLNADLLVGGRITA